MSSISKATADKNQRILLDLINKQPGNDTCADCKAKGPRWASHNLGIFLCVHCAGIHRKIGTHVTKVKSVTMDSWSKEQVEVMKSIGNMASNNKYNPNEARHSPPANREGSERDSEMEKYIRAKYESKRFMAKPQDQLSAERTSPLARRPSPVPPTVPKDQPAQAQAQPGLSSSPSQPTSSVTPASRSSIPSAEQSSVWNDLISLSNQSAQQSTPPNVNQYDGLRMSATPQVASPITTNPGISSIPVSNLNGNPVGTAFATSPNTSTSILSSQPPQHLSSQGLLPQPTQHFTQGLNYASPMTGQQTPFVHQGALTGYNPFTQPASAAGLSSIQHSSPYPQQMLVQTQSHPNLIGTVHNSQPGAFQPYNYQQGPIFNQSYLNTPQGFTPPPNLQQQQPFPGQPMDHATYLQWQQSQAGYSSTPQYNQWTS